MRSLFIKKVEFDGHYTRHAMSFHGVEIQKCSSGRFRSVDLGVPHINMSPTCFHCTTELNVTARIDIDIFKPGASCTAQRTRCD